MPDSRLHWVDNFLRTGIWDMSLIRSQSHMDSSYYQKRQTEKARKIEEDAKKDRLARHEAKEAHFEGQRAEANTAHRNAKQQYQEQKDLLRYYLARDNRNEVDEIRGQMSNLKSTINDSFRNYMYALSGLMDTYLKA